MSTQLSSAVPIARAVGTVGLGTAFGMMLSLSSWTFPILYEIKGLQVRDRLTFWSKAYDRGSVTAISLLTISAGALVFAARVGSSSLESKRLLYAAAAFGLTNLPFTRIVIIPTVHKLKDIEKDVAADPAAEKTSGDIDGMIKSWVAMHGGRITLTGVAFALAVSELILS